MFAVPRFTPRRAAISTSPTGSMRLAMFGVPFSRLASLGACFTDGDGNRHDDGDGDGKRDGDGQDEFGHWLSSRENSSVTRSESWRSTRTTRSVGTAACSGLPSPTRGAVT